jgi:hypothetical protein
LSAILRPEEQMSSEPQNRSIILRFLDSFLQEQNIKWMLGIGTLILFGSSVKLASANWNATSDTWKYVVLLAYAGAVAAAADQAYWRLGLRKTGNVLMGLTVLLLPVTFLIWSNVWTQLQSGVWRQVGSLLLLTLNVAAGWSIADRIFRHFLRERQPTFVVCYLALAAAGAVVPQLPIESWPVTGLALWGLMTVGSVKVHRHVFWLTEERRLPRVIGFFPVALLGAQFGLLFTAYLLPAVSREWLGLVCALVAVPVLATTDATAGVFQQRTGNLVRPLPLAIVLPLVTGLGLCAMGIGLAATGLPFPKALVPTAGVVAALLWGTARRTNKPAFVWIMLLCVVLSYNFSYALFRDLAKQLVDRGAIAVHEERLPIAFYGLTYLPLLTCLAGAAAWAKRRANGLLAEPARRFVIGLSCVWLVAAFQHPKAVFPVGVAMLAMFALQIGLFRNARLIIPAVAAFVTASFGLSTFAAEVCRLDVPQDMRLIVLACAGAALLYPGKPVDRFISRLSIVDSADVSSPVQRFCQRASLGITLLVAIAWCRAALFSRTPQELLLSQGLIFALLLAQALDWNSPRLGVFVLVFAAAGGIIQAAHLQVPAETILSAGTIALLGLWLGSYWLPRTGSNRFTAVFEPAFRRFGGVCLTLLLPLCVVDLAGATMLGRHFATWLSLVLIVAWAFDAARRWASPVHTAVGCLGAFGLASAGLTVVLGLAASREWLLTAWAATALAGVGPMVLLGRRFDRCKSSNSIQQPTGCEDSALWAIVRPLEAILLAGLLTTAGVSTVFFTMPMRVAGATAVAGLAGLAFGRRQPVVRAAFVIGLNWQLLSLLVEAFAPDAEFPFLHTWAIPASLPLALGAAASTHLTRLLSGCELNATARDLLHVHRHAMNALTAVMLLASLGHPPTGMSVPQLVMAAAAFGLAIAAILQAACRSNDVHCVWWAQVLVATALAYFAHFRVIHFGSGVAPFAFLGAGFTLWGIARAVAGNRRFEVINKPFTYTGMALPMAAALVATWRHITGHTPTMLGINSLALLAAAAFYFWRGIDDRRKWLLVVSALILDCAVGMLWRELRWTDPQLFLMPLGLSVLGLVELLQTEIPRPMHDPLRYAGALVILVSPTFHIVGGSWLHLFTLMAASVVVTLMSIGLRVRALMYAGVAFLLADLVAVLVRGSIDRPNLLWIAGVGLGAAVLILGALCENRREVLLQRLRILSAELETWR